MAYKYCLICKRIQDIKENRNPYFISELPTGYVVLGDHQFQRGYTLFLCKQHVTELHKLTPRFKNRFLLDMSKVAEAVYKVFKPIKLNYELLGNSHSHMHWHLFPRYNSDLIPNEPVWVVDKKIRESKKNILTDKERLRFIHHLQLFLKRV